MNVLPLNLKLKSKKKLKLVRKRLCDVKSKRVKKLCKMQHDYVLRNFYFWHYKGAGTFHDPRAAVVFRLQTPFQVSQGFILAQ